MADFPKLKDSDMADLEKYTADLANALAGKLETINNEISETNQSIQDLEENVDQSIQNLQKNVNENTNDLLATKQFIENSMKTMETEGTSIHVIDSADYPCQLNVEGKSEQKTRSGVNQLKITATNQTIRGITYTINEDKTVTANGTVTAEGFSSIRLVENINKSFGGYMLSGCPSGGGASTYLLRATYTDGTYDNDMGDGVVLQDKPIDYVMTRIEKNYTVNNIVFKPMISETAADYEEHGVMPSPDYPSEIENVSGDLAIKVVGKNLFNYNSEVTNFGSTYATKEQISNGYKMTATITGGAQRCQLIIPMEILTVGKKYTLSYKSDFNPTQIRVGDADGIGDTTGYDKYGKFIDVTAGKITFTLTEKSEKYLIFALYNQTAKTGDTYSIWDIQLELGETATAYEAYKEQVVTFPLGEQKLMKDGYLGDEAIHNKRVQIISTGNEYWSKRTGKNNSFNLTLNNKAIKGICNTYKSFTSPTEIDTKDGIYLSNSSYAIVTDLRFTDVTEFKNWLAEQYTNGTPVIIEYEVEKEETTPYTEEQRTAYNALQKLKTYRTVTNITNSQDTNMVLTYKKDLQTQFQELEALVLESGV